MSARKLPRAKGSKAPSLRDRLIYRQVTIGCRLQCAVAKEFALCEGQVSRIVKRVKEWLGTQTRMERGELPHVAEQRVGRWLAIARAEEMYAEARRLVEEAGGERSGQKTEDRGQGTEDRVLPGVVETRKAHGARGSCRVAALAGKLPGT
jgi:hypothetical protein